MNKYKFCDGQKLRSISWNENICELCEYIIDIEVIMENGQMAAVPWAVSTGSDGSIAKHNLSFVETVVYLDKEAKHENN